MKYSNFAKISRLFQTTILLHKNIFFAINFTFQLLKDCLNETNNINEVGVTDPIEENRCIAEKF